MKVRVCYTINVSDGFRKALRSRYGLEGLATREEIAEHYRLHGGTLDDEIIFEYDEENNDNGDNGQ